MKTHLLLFVVYLISFVDNAPLNKNELTSKYWYDYNFNSIESSKKLSALNEKAKNVILFIGDGMGMSTVTAARILKGQLAGFNGEEQELYFENFPNIALIKTYNVDKQVPDSAGTATAILCGVKASFYTVGVNGQIRMGEKDCDLVEKNKVESIIAWSQKANKSTGIVTTTRITHATPSAGYAHLSHRFWEDDKTLEENEVIGKCKDIALQLIEDEPGSKLNVILGGGRMNLMSNLSKDPATGEQGMRKDKDLIEEWKNIKLKQGVDKNKFTYVNSSSSLKQIDVDNLNYLLGLFSYDHMHYDAERVKFNLDEPSLEEMVEAAIKVLSKNENGYFLLVEGGKIDLAHHDNLAYLALHDTLAMEKAVIKASEMTSSKDTMFIITADHSHAFTVNGYPDRGNAIFGVVNEAGVIFTTLMYSTGPGYTSPRNHPVDEDYTSLYYHQHSAVNLTFSTHSGEDVALYSKGPMSSLLQGVKDQSYIAHAMAYSSCVGPYHDFQHCKGSMSYSATFNPSLFNHLLLIISFAFQMIINLYNTCS